MRKRYPLILLAILVVLVNLLVTFFFLDPSLCIKNHGVVFGMEFGIDLFIQFLIIVSLLVISVKSRTSLRYNMLALAILGTGNLFERILRGYICDYINIFSVYINLVDIGITSMIIISLIFLIKEGYADKNRGRI